MRRKFFRTKPTPRGLTRQVCFVVCSSSIVEVARRRNPTRFFWGQAGTCTPLRGQAGACTPLRGLRPRVGILLRKITAHIPPSNFVCSIEQVLLIGFGNPQIKFGLTKPLNGETPLNVNLYRKGGNYSCRRSITTSERSSDVKGFAFVRSLLLRKITAHIPHPNSARFYRTSIINRFRQPTN